MFRVYDNIEECAKNADVIVTATFTEEPIIKLNYLKKNVHINGKFVVKKKRFSYSQKKVFIIKIFRFE